MKKKEILEIENKILRNSLDEIRKCLDEFEQTPLEIRYKFETMIHCLSGINANANEEYIQSEIEFRKMMGKVK